MVNSGFWGYIYKWSVLLFITSWYENGTREIIIKYAIIFERKSLKNPSHYILGRMYYVNLYYTKRVYFK